MAFARGLILEQPEKERDFFGAGRGLTAVKIPKQRLAGTARLGIVLIAPERIDGTVIALDAFACRKERLEDGKDLQPRVAIQFMPPRVKRKEILSFKYPSRLCVLHVHVAVEEK